MAIQTIVFAAPYAPTAVHVRNLSGGAETSGSNITALDDGLYSAIFASLSGNFSLHLLDGAAVLGVGAVWNVTDTAATFYEQDLEQPMQANSTERNKIADHVRRRTQANVEASADGDTLSKSSEYGFIQQAQESNTVDNAGSLTIYKTDGLTELGQITLATDAAADPVVGAS